MDYEKELTEAVKAGVRDPAIVAAIRVLGVSSEVCGVPSSSERARFCGFVHRAMDLKSFAKDRGETDVGELNKHFDDGVSMCSRMYAPMDAEYLERKKSHGL